MNAPVSGMTNEQFSPGSRGVQALGTQDRSCLLRSQAGGALGLPGSHLLCPRGSLHVPSPAALGSGGKLCEALPQATPLRLKPSDPSHWAFQRPPKTDHEFACGHAQCWQKGTQVQVHFHRTPSPVPIRHTVNTAEATQVHTSQGPRRRVCMEAQKIQ